MIKFDKLRINKLKNVSHNLWNSINCTVLIVLLELLLLSLQLGLFLCKFLPFFLSSLLLLFCLLFDSVQKLSVLVDCSFFFFFAEIQLFDGSILGEWLFWCFEAFGVKVLEFLCDIKIRQRSIIHASGIIHTPLKILIKGRVEALLVIILHQINRELDWAIADISQGTLADLLETMSP